MWNSVALLASHLKKKTFMICLPGTNPNICFFFLLCACGCIFFQDIMNLDGSRKVAGC